MQPSQQTTEMEDNAGQSKSEDSPSNVFWKEEEFHGNNSDGVPESRMHG